MALGVPHTATSYAGPASFNTGNIPDGSTSAAITLNVAGVYSYKCSYHPQMLGTITVTG
jgi:plastocyanin